MDQIEGLRDPKDDNYGNEDDDDGDPPRLWYPRKGYPGCAFTRSIGDEVAEAIGVHADPEIIRKELEDIDKTIISNPSFLFQN